MADCPTNVPVLKASRVSKRFGATHALRQASIEAHAGEVLAVVGENGAGKSTLMKILAGAIQPSAGALQVDGEVVEFVHVRQALLAGIALIHQELNLAPHLNVAENVFLGREIRRFGFVFQRRMAEGAKRLLQRLGLNTSPFARLDSISLGQQQLVEIAKALGANVRVLIMDEPTSSLSQQDADRLYDVIRQLRSEGVAIIYISHRLQEVMDLADRVVVMRDGEVVGELTGDEISRGRMVRMMVGRDLAEFFPRTAHSTGDVVFAAHDLRTTAFPNRPLNFTVRAGEVVGLAGLVGSGRTEMLASLFGVCPRKGGQTQLAGRNFSPRRASDAIRAGIVLAPEDRRRYGLFLSASVRENLSIACLSGRLSRFGFILRGPENEAAHALIDQLRIKTASAETPVGSLSGGNQQKAALGKWLGTEPRLLLLDEPTRGIDVGSKAEVYHLMHELAGQGLAILFASSDMEEILHLSDRVLVMHRGAITGELSREEMSEEAIMHLAVDELSATDARQSG